MRISKVKLNNYVCFYDAPEFELGPGINFVVGKNNAGKTSLVDALCGKRGVPYKIPQDQSSSTRVASSTNVASWIIEYQFSRNEVLQLVPKEGTDDEGYLFLIPWTTVYSQVPITPEENAKKLIDDGFNLEVKYTKDSVRGFSFPRFDQLREHPNSNRIPLRRIILDNDMSYRDVGKAGKQDLSQLEHNWKSFPDNIRNKLFRFEAQRVFDPSSEPRPYMALQSNASNLPQVVNEWKSGDDDNFREYMSLIQRVLPDVKSVLAPPMGNGQVGLEIRFGGNALSRSFVDIPYQNCGDGIRNILAMLYAVVKFKDSVVVAIDEPQSFLHPGAIRALLNIFNEYDRHQYVIATHSPAAIAAVREKTILHVERKDVRSRVRALDAKDTKALGETFRSLGMMPSDFLGVDAIVWVEGPTEKRCFPLILEAAGLQVEAMRFIPIAEIGDPTGKNAKKFIALLEAVAKDVGLLPREAICVCDGDKAKDLVTPNTEREVRVETLSRQNYESHFLDYSDIAVILSDLINNEDGQAPPKPCTAETVQTWIDDNVVNDKFYPDGRLYDRATWLTHINGAKFLSAMFRKLAHPTRKYKKVKDGEEITKRILADNPDHFQEIVDLIKSILRDAAN